MDAISTISPRIVAPIVNTEPAEITNNQTDGVNITQTGQTGPGDARFFGIFLGFLVVFLGTTGNGLTVWAYTRNRNLQTSFNVLIANLCLVELAYSTVVIPLALPGFITGFNVYPEWFCSIVGYIYYTSIASSLYNLVAIAVNRYIGIVKSGQYQQLFTGQRLALCIASVWLVPAILYLPVVIGGAIAWRQDSLRCSIGENDIPAAIKWYNLSLNIIFQAIPLVILIVLYTAIFRKVKQVQQKMKVHRSIKKKSSKIVKDHSTASNASAKNKSGGNTSGDDTGDEFRPSSLIEGITFKPVQNSTENHSSNQREEATPSDVVSPISPQQKEEIAVSTNLLNNNIEASPATTKSYRSDEEAVPPQPQNQRRKRNSIWTLLLRNSQKINSRDLPRSLEKIDSPTLSVSTDAHLSEDDTTTKSPATVNNENGVKMRHNSIELKEMRRKKSLSAPNLPHFDFTNPDIAKLDKEAETKKPTRQYLNVPAPENIDTHYSDNESVMARSRSAYVKKSDSKRQRAQSDNTDKSPLKTKTSWSVRVKRTTKEWASNLSLQNDSDNDSQHGNRPRLGTIARKVQERRSRRERRDKRRQKREKMMRKKHARERQLVYSSLTICVAFAVCIMPTALLYLVQVLTGIEVAAGVVLIVGCIAWLHAVVNPLIYGYLNTQYRKEYSRIATYVKNKLMKSNDSYTPDKKVRR